jgi:hypothetical protein
MDRYKGFADHCMAEYDLDGWRRRLRATPIQ